MLRQAAEKTGDMVGDGTTTFNPFGSRHICRWRPQCCGGSKRGRYQAWPWDRAAKRAIEALRSLSRPVKIRKEKAQVAAISAHNDPSIGDLVADAMDKVGGKGVITAAESKTTETARCGRRHAVRSWLRLALLSHGPREDGGRDGGRPDLDFRPENRRP